jgi:guanidinobutyrase / D-arginase
MSGDERSEPQGPVDATVVPRFAGPATFARLPRRDEVGPCDVAIVGIPFDSGVTYRPGARFGPGAIRAGSKLLRPYHPGLDVEPFAVQQVADAGDLACNPFDIAEAITTIEDGANELLADAGKLVAIGGDHTIALPLLRATRAKFGQVALVHFDAHLDTWDTYFGAPYTHGTPFRRAAEEGLFASERSAHVGIRGPLYASTDIPSDEQLGFTIVSSADYARSPIDDVATRLRERVGDAPVYLSIDVDVMDPAHAPGTGTPEAGGLTSRELLLTLRALDGLPIVGADVVEVAPAYDHAELTTVAASHVVYELLGLMAAAASSDV